MDDLGAVLKENPYPGRGVLWCVTGDGTRLGVYFLTGRSPASRSRSLRLDGRGDLVVAAREKGVHDPLRHYVAARQQGDWLVYGNGEQVAVVAGRLAGGEPTRDALDGLDYEPDPPVFTPRITVVAGGPTGGEAWFGAARRSSGKRAATDRMTLRVADADPGEGVLVTTYRSDVRTVETGAPYTEVRTAARDREALLDEVWSSLDPGLRVAAAVFEPGALGKALIRES
ncbi:IMP cyclohydrolase [Actinacidiphila yeochonensis]|uniref:IMP cyclohydrolase n=1 Tax=Actinacidiphila yeochonensis TaxID=89050 RepID=UPI00055D553B|nr:IMP cyclohydrolase [Actinacidiphila yeochonensis]